MEDVEIQVKVVVRDKKGRRLVAIGLDAKGRLYYVWKGRSQALKPRPLLTVR